jgi:hypothetical protein
VIQQSDALDRRRFLVFCFNLFCRCHHHLLLPPGKGTRPSSQTLSALMLAAHETF